MDKISVKIPKTSFVGNFFDFLGPPDSTGFLSKFRFRYFSYFMDISNFMQKLKKNCGVSSDILLCERTNEWTTDERTDEQSQIHRALPLALVFNNWMG